MYFDIFVSNNMIIIIFTINHHNYYFLWRRNINEVYFSLVFEI